MTHGIQPIAGAHDLIALDAYIKHLPMNYEPHLDRIRRRGRLTFASHIASLLPLYGRSTGTGRAGHGRSSIGTASTGCAGHEAHLITIHPLLAPYTTKAIRLWGKYGAWY
ncbi:MAG: hypothetical protein M3461_19355 [Pseudomonadota bacterium]|nr:hypothetical protein [Pseudomonadota bacterium]